MPRTTVLLIRHAEKLEWNSGLEPSAGVREAYEDNHKLSPKGYERSHALVGYFTSRKEMVELMKKRPLSLIIAQDVDTETGFGKSDRPRETIWPLMNYQKENCTNDNRGNIADLLELRLLRKNEWKMVKEICLDSRYQDKTILVCWCHQQLPQITSSLGVPNAPKWPKGRFDLTWVIDLDSSQLELSILPQNLMFGDSPKL